MSGFVVSAEFLLVLALVIFPLLIGGFLIARKLVTLGLNQLAQVEQPLSRPVIWDSSDPGGTGNKPVGPVIGYDQFEAPLVLYRDNTLGTGQPGVLMGVRPNRFTTVAEVYYDQQDCPEAGPAYVRKVPDSYLDLDFISPLQDITYGVGNGNVLWRQNPTAPLDGDIKSRWKSQNVGDDSPAEHNNPGIASFACTNIDLTSTLVLDDFTEILYVDPTTPDFGPDPLAGAPAIPNTNPLACPTATAVATYGPGPVYTPTAHTLDVGTTYVADIIFNGSSQQALSHAAYVGTGIQIYVIDTSRVIYCITPVTSPANEVTPNPSTSGQSQYLQVTVGGAGGADFYEAIKVTDLDGPGNFKAPFRMAFAKAVAVPAPTPDCPGGEGCP